MKKILYAITLVLAIAMCLSLLVFPILKFNPDAIYRNHQEVIDTFIEKEADSGKTKEQLKEEAVNDIIYDTCFTLQMYYNSKDVVYDEDGNEIDSSNNLEAIMMDIYRIKEKGIKYTDLANSIKNSIEYNQILRKQLKAEYGKVPLKEFNKMRANPFPMIGIMILFALEFACAFLVIVRSIKGINEKKRNKLLTISAFGVGVSAFLLLMPSIFTKDMVMGSETLLSDYVTVLIMNVEGTTTIYYCFIGFIVTLAISIVARVLRYKKKIK